jgi:hypothetical protein
MPASDLRRAFLRAYAHEELGLTKTYSYLAPRWLTDLGYPTKVSEPQRQVAEGVGCAAHRGRHGAV